MELAAGTRVGPYEIQRQIGEGGMGVVYRALDHRLGRQVAIKVLPAALVADPGRLKRFEQEARTIGALNHPNLVTLHDVGHHDNAPYLVTELLDGQSLRQKLAAGPLARRDIIAIATEIAHGLSAAHGAGIVHRDIKPDNIFVLGDGRVKILDFGIAKLKRDEPVVDLAVAPTGMQEKADHLGTAGTGTGIVIGTPGYMAPEQLAGGAVDFRTDIFAFGVVLFEMLARKRPFAADTNIEESYAIMKSEPVALPAGIAPALARIVMRCLEKRPEARFQSAADLAFAIDSLDTDVQSSAPQPVVQLESGPIPTNAPTRPDLPATVNAPVRAWGRLALLIALIVVIGGVVVWIVNTARPRAIAPAPASPPTVLATAWPSLVDGGAEFQRVTFHTESEWFARFSPDGKSILYSIRDDSVKSKDELAQKIPDKTRWRIVRSFIDRASVAPLGIEGRLLDVKVDQTPEQLAIRRPLPDKEGGILATVTLGVGKPLDSVSEIAEASFGPDDTMAIVRHDRDGSVIEFPIGTAIWRAKRTEVRSLRVSPNGKHLAFSKHVNGEREMHVVIVDARGKSPVNIAHPDVSGIAWRNDHEIWFSSGNTIRALTVDNKQRLLLRDQLRIELKDVDREGHMLVTPIDERFQLHTGAGGNGAAGGPFRATAWLDAAELQSISGDGKTFAAMIANGADETMEGRAIYVGSADGDATLLGHGEQVALLPDGSAAIVLAAKGDPVRFVAIKTGSTNKALSVQGLEHVDFDHPISIAPDGTHVVVRANAPGDKNRAWAIPLDGGPPAPVGLPVDVSPIYALGTDRIAYAEDNGITIVPLTGGAPVAITAPHAETPIRFSDDGKALFVMRQHGWPRIVERLELATQKRTPWATIPVTEKPEVFQLALSGDGKTIAYSVSVQTSDLYVVRPPH